MVQAEFCAIVNCQIATQNSKMKYFNLTKLGSIKFLEKQSHSDNIGMKEKLTTLMKVVREEKEKRWVSWWIVIGKYQLLLH